MTELAEILTRVRTFLTTYVVFANPAQATAVTLWVAHTWLIDAAETSPILAILSPEKRSGKTKLLDCLELLVRGAWRVIQPTAAVFFRMFEDKQPTVLMDEADAMFRNARIAERHEDVRAAINAGNRRGTTVARCVGEGSKMRLQTFAVFSAEALAGIGGLPDTVADRSIVIQMRRRAKTEQVERFRSRDAELAAIPIREWLEAAAEQVQLVPFVPVPDELDDRAADGWEPLLAIADAAGGDWPVQARKAAIELSGIREPEDESLSVQLAH